MTSREKLVVGLRQLLGIRAQEWEGLGVFAFSKATALLLWVYPTRISWCLSIVSWR